jgi:hypothetical protein
LNVAGIAHTTEVGMPAMLVQFNIVVYNIFFKLTLIKFAEISQQVR